jgi:hypothetical protein
VCSSDPAFVKFLGVTAAFSFLTESPTELSKLGSRKNQCCGSGSRFDRVSGSGSEFGIRIQIQEGKNDPQIWKKIKKFHVLKARCSFLRAEGFFVTWTSFMEA